MFTGIIQEVGRIKRVLPASDTTGFWIEAGYRDLKEGESVAVDGVCLTVEEITKTAFKVTISIETKKLTTLGRAREGMKVNLERALQPRDRFGGHIVTGHVDTTIEVLMRRDLQNTSVFKFGLPQSVERYVARKGSVAINGVSLTVNDVGPDYFEVMLIPYTLTHTNLGELEVGASVNLEVDLLARYVQRILEPSRDSRLRDLLK